MQILPSGRGAKIRLALLFAVLAWACWLGKAWVLVYYLTYSPQEGDVVFQSLPHGELADAIEGVTRSPYSHCGVVLRENGEWVVIEAIVSVHETPLLRWMQRGRGAGFAVYRPDARFQAVMPQFKTALRSYLGKPYDYDYEMSDKAIYCSELVYKGFKTASGEELGKLERPGGSELAALHELHQIDAGDGAGGAGDDYARFGGAGGAASVCGGSWVVGGLGREWRGMHRTLWRPSARRRCWSGIRLIWSPTMSGSFRSVELQVERVKAMCVLECVRLAAAFGLALACVERRGQAHRIGSGD
jgi:hypothetical protein